MKLGRKQVFTNLASNFSVCTSPRNEADKRTNPVWTSCIGFRRFSHLNILEAIASALTHLHLTV